MSIYLFFFNFLLGQGFNHIDSYAINYNDNYINNIINNNNNLYSKELNNFTENKVYEYKKNNTNSGYYIKGGYIIIKKIGILQPMYIMNIGDFNTKIKEKKDKNIINMEINDFFNIDNGFFIGGHSSGYFFDKSDKKEIFKDLEKLSIGDYINIIINTNKGLIEKKYMIKKRIIGKNIRVNKTDKIIYTCYPNNTSKERLVLFLE